VSLLITQRIRAKAEKEQVNDCSDSGENGATAIGEESRNIDEEQNQYGEQKKRRRIIEDSANRRSAATPQPHDEQERPDDERNNRCGFERAGKECRETPKGESGRIHMCGCRPNENKMSDGHRERAWTGVKGCSSRKT